MCHVFFFLIGIKCSAKSWPTAFLFASLSLSFLLFTTRYSFFSRFRLQSQTRITKRINDTLYKLFSLPELTRAVTFRFDMLEFSFRFIVRTCDLKTCKEQEQQDKNNKTTKDKRL
jgi:hypothetical protein